jgi:hypothetical protein
MLAQAGVEVMSGKILRLTKAGQNLSDPLERTLRNCGSAG